MTASMPAIGVRLSLVMCTVGDRKRAIIRLLDSLKRQTNQAFELIVIDQNDRGKLDALLEGPFSFPVRRAYASRGLSRSRNVGLDMCSSGLVAFPDDDCWYPPELVDNIIALFARRSDLDIATGRTVDANNRDSNGRFIRKSCAVRRANVWYAGNSNAIFVRRQVFDLIGRFDESLGAGSGTPYGAGEETDFLLRAIDRHLDVEFFHDLIVHHDQVNTNGSVGTFEKARTYSLGFGRTLRLNHYSIPYVVFRASRSWAAAMLALLQMNTTLFKLKLIWVKGTLAGYFASPPAHRS